MRQVGYDEETVPRPENRLLAGDGDLEAPRRDVRHLAMRVMVNGADRARLEVHAYHHEIGPVAENLSTDAGLGILPGNVGVMDEGVAHGVARGSGVRERPEFKEQ